MFTRFILLSVIMSLLVVAGCTAVPDPTLETIAGGVVTVEGVRPSVTPGTPSSTPTISAIGGTPTIEATMSALASQEETLSQLKWAPSLNLIKLIDVDPDTRLRLVWSPVANEFAFLDCTEDPDASPLSVLIASEPDFEPINLPSSDIVCYMNVGELLWNPNGQQIITSGLSTSNLPIKPGMFDLELFIADRVTMSFYSTDITGRFLKPEGWMDGQFFVFSQYFGGGHFAISIADMNSNEVVSYSGIYAGTVLGLNTEYVVTVSGIFTDRSAAYFSKTPLPLHSTPLTIGGPSPYLLSKDNENNRTRPNSTFMDWNPKTNEILVSTWEEPFFPEDLLEKPGVVNTQLWDITTNTLVMVASDSVYGRISPSGREIVYLTVTSDPAQLHLLNRRTEGVVFSQPAYVEAGHYEAQLNAYTSFSPDGRFLTFYSPTPELMIYDLETDTFLPPLTAVPFTPLWSPDSTRLVYQHPTDGLSIFDMRTQAAYPLAASGSDHLSNPQWSFDGTYLSVTVKQEDGSQDTAVLQFP